MGAEWYQEIGGEWTPPPPKVDPKHPDKKPRLSQWLPLVLGRQEVQSLLAAPVLTDLERLAMRTLYASGMREDELVALAREALDPAASTLNLGSRLVLVDDATMTELLALDWTLWKWTVQALEDLVRRAAQGCGVLERFEACGRTLLPKALRNAYAAHCLENGMDLFSLHFLLGHTYIDTTEKVIDVSVHWYRAVYDSTHPYAAGGLVDQVYLTREMTEAISLALATDDDDDEVLRGGGPQAHLTETETQTLIEAGVSDHDRLLLRVLYAAGLRVQEAVKLLYCDIQYDEARLFIRQSKELKDRYTLIDRETCARLKARQGGQALGTPVFDVGAREIDDIIDKVAESTGIGPKYDALGFSLSAHTFRHAYATHTYQRGMAPLTVQTLLGHEDLETTIVYAASTLPKWQSAYKACHLFLPVP